MTKITLTDKTGNYNYHRLALVFQVSALGHKYPVFDAWKCLKKLPKKQNLPSHWVLPMHFLEK